MLEFTIDELIWLEQYTNGTDYVKQQMNCNAHHSLLYRLTEAEAVVCCMFINAYSNMIQKNLSPHVKKSMYDTALWHLLDSAILKLRDRTNFQVLYRAEMYGDISHYTTGQIFCHPYYLTTTSDINVALTIANTKFVWEIILLQDTVAVRFPSVLGEQQVEFPRGTQFQVVKIENRNETPYLCVKELSLTIKQKCKKHIQRCISFVNMIGIKLFIHVFKRSQQVIKEASQ